jgi:Na+/melibiose symporter-like transporter
MTHIWRVLRSSLGFRWVLAAGLISQTGDWILGIGLAYYVYAETGSTLVSGSVLFVAFLPQILLGSVAGVFVDRWDRRNTMIAANLAMAFALLPLLLVDGSTIWPIYPVLLVVNAVEQFFVPAEQAIIPTLVDESDLITANALNAQMAQIARLVGAAAGGVAAEFGGILAVVLLDLASYLLAAALLALLPRRRLAPAEPVELAEPVTNDLSHAVGDQVTGVLHEWRAGLEVIRRQSTLRLLLCVAALTSLGEGIFGTLFAPYVRDVISGSAADYGAIMSTQAVGGILAGLVVAAVGHRYTARGLFGWGLLVFGLLDLALFMYPLVADVLWPAFVLIALVGLPGAATLAGRSTLLQTSTEDWHRGRVFGALGAIKGCGLLVGVLVAGVLGDLVGIMPVLAWQGGMYVVSGVLVLALMRRTTATLSHAGEEPDDANSARAATGPPH